MSYRCQGDNAKFPEGGTIKCMSGRSIQTPGATCKIECDVGSPNYKEIECKTTHGWRPTSKLKCEGVAPGVIVGALIGAFVGVILIAYMYAKYKQSKKQKELQKNPPPPKNNSRRPGAALKGNQVARKPPPTAQKLAKPPVLPPPEYEQKPPRLEENEKEVNPTVHNDMKKSRGTRANPSRKHRVPEPSADDWHFRNQGYEDNEVPTDGYQTGYRGYSSYPDTGYQSYNSYHELPSVGYHTGYPPPPPRPPRSSGVYSVSDQY